MQAIALHPQIVAGATLDFEARQRHKFKADYVQRVYAAHTGQNCRTNRRKRVPIRIVKRLQSYEIFRYRPLFIS